MAVDVGVYILHTYKLFAISLHRQLEALVFHRASMKSVTQRTLCKSQVLRYEDARPAGWLLSSGR